MNRRERRALAREMKTKFIPTYRSTTRVDEKGNKLTYGGKPKTHEEMFGIGYERFNNKFVTIREVEEEVEKQTASLEDAVSELEDKN